MEKSVRAYDVLVLAHSSRVATTSWCCEYCVLLMMVVMMMLRLMVTMIHDDDDDARFKTMITRMHYEVDGDDAWRGWYRRGRWCMTMIKKLMTMVELLVMIVDNDEVMNSTVWVHGIVGGGRDGRDEIEIVVETSHVGNATINDILVVQARREAKAKTNTTTTTTYQVCPWPTMVSSHPPNSTDVGRCWRYWPNCRRLRRNFEQQVRRGLRWTPSWWSMEMNVDGDIIIIIIIIIIMEWVMSQWHDE